MRTKIMSRTSMGRLVWLLVIGVSAITHADELPPPEQEAPPQPPMLGTVRGRVLDAATQEGLPAATVTAGGTTFATELDGTYTIALPPGTYTIVFSTPEYGEQRREIAIVDGATVTLDLALAPVPKSAGQETIELYDTLDTHKDSAVLAERRAAGTVSDAISAEQIQRSPDSTASDAAKRIVAATVQDNRYLVVRGLGGRYSLTLLNGIPLPSPDPDLPAAPLDLFPAAMLTNLTITKTFAPDLPANFAGGALSLETRSYPTRFLFKAKVAMGADSESTLHALNRYDGGSLDVLGYDDGTRALPSVISDTKLAGDPSLSQDQLRAQASAFANNWVLRSGTAAPNLSLGATLGDTLRIADQRLGYFASASYGHGRLQRVARIARVGEPDGSGGHLPSVLQLEDHQGIEQAALSGIASLGWTISPRHQINLFSLYSHTGDAVASRVAGVDNSTAVVDRTRLSFVERQLWFGELFGEHKLADNALTVRWQGNLAAVAQHEPDTRDLLRTETPDGRYVIDHGSGSAERLFAELGDTTGGGGLDAIVPVGWLRLSAGGAVSHGSRTYQARRFHFDVLGDTAFLPPEMAFSASNAGSGMSMYERCRPTATSRPARRSRPTRWATRPRRNGSG